MLSLLSLAALASPPVEAAPPIASRMHEHFQVATTVRDAVMQGDLPGAQGAARDLVDLDPPEGLPGPWRPWVAQLKARAASLAEAKSLEQASRIAGELGTACADCHREMGGGPGLDRMKDLPSQQWSSNDTMPLHRWAVDWMWLGLIASDDAAWQRGVGELNDRPLAPRFQQLPPGQAARQLEQEIYAIAAEGAELSPEKHTARGELMGRMLATCAGCHRLRDQGRVPPTPAVTP